MMKEVLFGLLVFWNLVVFGLYAEDKRRAGGLAKRLCCFRHLVWGASVLLFQHTFSTIKRENGIFKSFGGWV